MIKRFFVAEMSAVLFLVLLAGCSYTLQGDGEVDSNNGINTNVEVTDNLGKNNDGAGEGQKDQQNGMQGDVFFMDEKLDENLFISAELRMPRDTLYSYGAVLKSFDYDKVMNAIGQNSAEVIGGEAGSLRYIKNEMASHLDTYCSYAGDHGLASDKDLSFLSKEDAEAKVCKLMEQLKVSGELGMHSMVCMNKTNLIDVQRDILKDEYYGKILYSKGYGNDVFDDDLEAYLMTFQMEINGVPLFRNDPYLQQTSDTMMAYPVVVTALLSNSGFEMITMTGMLEPCSGNQKEAVIIGENGIKDALMKKFGDVILPVEYKAVNIWMEYFPMVSQGSFTEVNLIPAWCIDFEINGRSASETKYTLRINAITGDEIS